MSVASHYCDEAPQKIHSGEERSLHTHGFKAGLQPTAASSTALGLRTGGTTAAGGRGRGSWGQKEEGGSEGQMWHAPRTCSLPRVALPALPHSPLGPSSADH